MSGDNDRTTPPKAAPAAPADLTDEQLLAAHRDGRADAFEALVRRYRPELLHFLIRFAGNRAAGEDLFQETFLQVHVSAHTFDVSKRFKPWLFTIGANKARDHLRKHKRQKTVPLSATLDSSNGEGPSFVDLMSADLPLPDDLAEDGETAALVKRAVDDLPDHLREVLLLAYFNQFPYKQIAEMLGIPLGTVKSRLHAAVGTFAQLWKARHPNLTPSPDA
ncbi:MAG: RNA polymerase sigma factor [Planctomycetota bacterium]